MGYNDDLPVSTINSVANAILPLVMSLMPGSLLYVSAAAAAAAKESGIRRQVPLNATFWAPFDAHDPLLVQEIVLGLALSPAQNLDLNVAEGAKRCECGRHEDGFRGEQNGGRARSDPPILCSVQCGLKRESWMNSHPLAFFQTSTAIASPR